MVNTPLRYAHKEAAARDGRRLNSTPRGSASALLPADVSDSICQVQKLFSSLCVLGTSQGVWKTDTAVQLLHYAQQCAAGAV